MTRPLRIVHCFRSPVGGIFRHVRDLTDAQVAAGHKVGIVCDSSTGGDYEAKLFDQMEGQLELGVHRTPMQRHIGPGDVGAAFRTYKLIKGLQPDVLHGHGAKGGVYSRVFGSLLRVSRSRVARLYSPHGGSLHYDADTMTGRVIFRAERALELLTDQLLFVSAYEERVYRAKVGIPRGKASLASHLRKAAGIEGVKAALLRETADAQTLADPARLAAQLKALPLTLTAPRPLAEAISTAGGVPFDEIDAQFMLRRLPGVFVAGEMLDWEAPTGGYLLSACLATGRAAGGGLREYLDRLHG